LRTPLSYARLVKRASTTEPNCGRSSCSFVLSWRTPFTRYVNPLVSDGKGSARSLKHAMQYVHQVVTACRSFNASTRIAIRLGLSVKTLCPPSTTLPFWCAALPQSTSRSPPVLAQPQTCRLSTVAGSRLPLYVLLSAEPLRQLT